MEYYRGAIPTLTQLSSGKQLAKMNIFKSTISYGQGMRATFMQLLSAYNVFNNDGNFVAPSIVQTQFPITSNKILSDKTTASLKEMLIKTETKGTGKNALVE